MSPAVIRTALKRLFRGGPHLNVVLSLYRELRPTGVPRQIKRHGGDHAAAAAAVHRRCDRRSACTAERRRPAGPRDARLGALARAHAPGRPNRGGCAFLGGVSFAFNVSGGNSGGSNPTTVAMQCSLGFPNTHLKPCTGAHEGCGVAVLHVYVNGASKNNVTLPLGAGSWPNNTGATAWVTLLRRRPIRGASSCAVKGHFRGPR